MRERLLLRGADGLLRDQLAAKLVARDDLYADIAGAPQKIVHDGAVQDLEPSRSLRLADDDLRCVVGAGKCQDVFCDTPCSARHGDRFTTEPLGKAQRVGNAVALFFAEPQAAPRLDAERRPLRMQPVSHALGVAHEARGARILAHADEKALARGPRTRDGARLHLGEQLLVDALRGAPQGKLAQGRQIGRREEVLERTLGLLGDIDLPLLQALDQVAGCEIDKLDGIRPVEHRIRHRLAHTDARDLGDDVIQALDVLDVDRRVDVDAVVQQLLDVEIALWMAAAGSIGMRQLVDEDDLRAPRDDGIEVHFLERAALVFDLPAGDDLQPP